MWFWLQMIQFFTFFFPLTVTSLWNYPAWQQDPHVRSLHSRMPAGPMMPSMARLGSTCKMTCRWWKSFEGHKWAQDGLSIYIYYIYNGQIGGMLSIHFHNDLIWHLYTNSNDAGMTINIHKPYSIFWMAHLGFWPQGPWRSLTEFTKHGDSNGDWSNKRFATDMQCRVTFLGSDSNGLGFLKHVWPAKRWLGEISATCIMDMEQKECHTIPWVYLRIGYPPFQWIMDFPIKIVIFHSYVKLPEGMSCFFSSKSPYVWVNRPGHGASRGVITAAVWAYTSSGCSCWVPPAYTLYAPATLW